MLQLAQKLDLLGTVKCEPFAENGGVVIEIGVFDNAEDLRCDIDIHIRRRQLAILRFFGIQREKGDGKDANQGVCGGEGKITVPQIFLGGRERKSVIAQMVDKDLLQHPLIVGKLLRKSCGMLFPNLSGLLCERLFLGHLQKGADSIGIIAEFGIASLHMAKIIAHIG